MFENINVSPSFKKSISTALSQGRLSHAVILEGGNIADALSAAKQIASYIQCTASHKPCGVCANCVKNSSGSHPDVHILEKQSNANAIKVDEIRELKKKATVLPNEAAKSVFIINSAEEMNVQAQNALLKIFEEPSPHVCFILTCRTKSPLLDTIISRATCYYLGGGENTADYDETVYNQAAELLNVYAVSDEYEFLKKTAVFVKNKNLFRQTLKAMLPIVRDALILKSGGRDISDSNRRLAEKFCNTFTLKKIINLSEQLQILSDQAENSANHNLLITRFCSVLYSIKTGN